MNRVASRLLALSVPLLILALGAGALLQFRPDAQQSHRRLIERRLQRTTPEVVILGNSITQLDVDPSLLSGLLDLPAPRPAQLFSLRNSGAPYWYAVIKNRFARERSRPRVVVIPSDLTSLLIVSARSDMNRDQIVGHLDGNDPVLQHKVFGGQSHANLWLDMRRGALRDSVVDRVKHTGVGVLFSRGPVRSLARRGRGAADGALERVFSEENVDWSLHNRVIPVVETAGEIGDDEIAPVAESLLPDLLALCSELGIRLVFARAPLGPATDQDRLPAEVEREVIRAFNASGHGYLDMRGIDLRPRHFFDPIHMNPAGQALFTRRLAEALIELDILGDGPIPEAILPVSLARVEREGVPPEHAVDEVRQLGPCLYETSAPFSVAPVVSARGYGQLAPFALRRGDEAIPYRAALPETASAETALSESCEPAAVLEGDRIRFRLPGEVSARDLSWRFVGRPQLEDDASVLWVPPGTSVRLLFSEPWTGPPDRFSLRVVAESFPTVAAPPVLEVGQERYLLPGERRHVLEVVPEVPIGAWSVTVHVPEGGNWLALQGWVVGRGVGRSMVLGSSFDNFGNSTRLVGGVRGLRGSEEFPRSPPALPDVQPIRRSRSRSAMFSVPWAKFLSDPVIANQNPMQARCSPLRVYEDGVPLARHHHTCGFVAARGAGHVCHEEDWVGFAPNDGGNLLRNGHHYELRLDPERWCKRSRWVYPGDLLRARPAATDLVLYRDGIRQVELDLTPFAPEDTAAPWTLVVRLLVNGEVVLEETATGAGRPDSVLSWLLEEAAPPGVEDVVLEIENLGESFLLVGMAALSEESELGPAVPVGQRELFGSALKVKRQGKVPELRPPTSIQSTSSPCGYKYELSGLEHISDSATRRLGLGRASPLVVTDRGRLLEGHASPKTAGAHCSGQFAHLDSTVYFSPFQKIVGDSTRRFTHRLGTQVPSSRGVGTDVYWVYPGTQLDFDLGEAEGPTELSVRVATVQSHEEDDLTVEVAAFGEVQVADQVWWTGDFQIEVTPEDSRLRLSVSSPEGGPYAVVDAVIVNRVPLVGRAERPAVSRTLRERSE